jgi:predicted Zn-ribbon and HTH transcriptional regulator
MMGMVHIVICQKCGEAFEADTASRETICPRCLIDNTNEDMALLNFYPELWVDNI